VSVFTVAVLPFVRYAYRSPALHIAIETADAVIALVVAYLVYGRYRQNSRQRDLLLTASLVVLAVANLPLTAVPAALALDEGEHLDAWAPLLVRVLGAALFAAAALTPRRRRLEAGEARRWITLLALLLLWLVVAGVLAANRLPAAVPTDIAIDATRPFVAGHPLLIAAQALSLVLYVSASVAYTRSAAAENDEFLQWLGAAAVLAAGARVNYLLFPSLYTDYLYTGDVLRLGFYLLLLVGAAREIRSYWSARVEAAVVRGRRDVTREIRDGLLPDRARMHCRRRLRRPSCWRPRSPWRRSMSRWTCCCATR